MYGSGNVLAASEPLLIDGGVVFLHITKSGINERAIRLHWMPLSIWES